MENFKTINLENSPSRGAGSLTLQFDFPAARLGGLFFKLEGVMPKFRDIDKLESLTLLRMTGWNPYRVEMDYSKFYDRELLFFKPKKTEPTTEGDDATL